MLDLPEVRQLSYTLTWEEAANYHRLGWIAELPPRPPTPLERALDILGPHLRDQPLYREETQP